MIKDKYKITVEYRTAIMMFSEDDEGESYGLPKKKEIIEAINQELDNLFTRENEGLQVLPYYSIETTKDKRKIRIAKV